MEFISAAANTDQLAGRRFTLQNGNRGELARGWFSDTDPFTVRLDFGMSNTSALQYSPCQAINIGR